MRKKITEMSILEKADFIRKKQEEIKARNNKITKGESFIKACKEIEKIEELEKVI